MGTVIPFDEAARRVRERRASAALRPADWFWMSAVVFWPVGLALFTVQAVLDAAMIQGRRR